MDNYLFLKNNNLEKIFFNGYLSTKYDSNMGIYNELTKSIENTELYWIPRPTLENYLNVDKNVNIKFSNWYYIKSNNFIGTKKHRIYLHLRGQAIPFVAKRFIEKCKERNIQFWFKFQFDNKRSDSMVFYPTDEQFPIFNDIIIEIINENKSLKSDILTPPLSSSLYGNNFGYGKEFENGNSWSEHISDLLTHCADHILYKYGSKYDFNKYSNLYLANVFTDVFCKEYQNNLRKNYITENVLNDSKIKKELNKHILSIFPKILNYIKNYDHVSKYIRPNGIIDEFYIGAHKFYIRISTILAFFKFFIRDIVDAVGKSNIINTLKMFIELNLETNRFFDISNCLHLEQY